MRKDYEQIPKYAKDYLKYLLTIRALSDKTVEQYYLDLRIFFRYLLCEDGLADIEQFDQIDASNYPLDKIKNLTLTDLYSFLNFTVKDRENDAKARARKTSALRSFFKYLSKNAMIDNNPTLHLESPKERRTLPVYLTYSEAVKLLEHVDGANKERDYAIITLFLNCGLRLSELVGINFGDIADRQLRVLGKGGKERILFLNDACMAALQTYIGIRKKAVVKVGHEKALFISRNGKRISNRMVEMIVDKCLRASGLNAEKYSPHKLRHTAATLMHQNGVDVRILQEVLGHSNLGTTQIYTHLENSEIEAAMKGNPLGKHKK